MMCIQSCDFCEVTFPELTLIQEKRPVVYTRIDFKLGAGIAQWHRAGLRAG
jgi:hypothetical protein